MRSGFRVRLALAVGVYELVLRAYVFVTLDGRGRSGGNRPLCFAGGVVS